MGDSDLDRIISDLRARRETLQRNIDETKAGAPERQRLVIATEKLRERLGGQKPVEEPEPPTEPESSSGRIYAGD